MRPHTHFKKNQIYHLTAKRTDNVQSLKNQWHYCLSEMNNLGAEYRIEVHAFVLMSNHFHCIINFKDDQIIRDVVEHIENFWCCTVHLEKIESFIEYKQVYRYIYRNPIEAGLSKTCEAYPYSSLRKLIYRGIDPFVELSIVDQMCVVSNPYVLLKWLNT